MQKTSDAPHGVTINRSGLEHINLWMTTTSVIMVSFCTLILVSWIMPLQDRHMTEIRKQHTQSMEFLESAKTSKELLAGNQRMLKQNAELEQKNYELNKAQLAALLERDRMLKDIVALLNELKANRKPEKK